jgi:hypothetical protein
MAKKQKTKTVELSEDEFEYIGNLIYKDRHSVPQDILERTLIAILAQKFDRDDLVEEMENQEEEPSAA